MKKCSAFSGINRLWQPTFIVLLALGIEGCGSGTGVPQSSIETDEAMKRAIAEQISVAQAAYNDFFPKKVEDYFDSMDSIVDLNANNYPGQLLDKLTTDVKTLSTTNPKLVSEENLRNEILGRNTWMIWCGGNEGFWDWLATDNLGFIDLLKLLDSRERNVRFRDGGLINEPKMIQAGTPPVGEFGLWLDIPEEPWIREWRAAYVAQTFKLLREGKHKSQIGLKKRGPSGKHDGPLLFVGDLREYKTKGYDPPSAYLSGNQSGYGEKNEDREYKKPYDEKIPPPDIYGLSSGIVGLRLFPNPYFDAEAQSRWDAAKFYGDKNYFNDSNLIRPYRVGVSCAYCHASFHPLKPPHSVIDPEWENISGNIGAQYLRIRKAFGNTLTEDNFIYHLLDSQPPGTIDTSLIASDNINNPNTMNSVFCLTQRVFLSLRNPPEVISPSSQSLPSLWQTLDGTGLDAVPKDLKKLFESQGLATQLAKSNDNPRLTPRVLLDGSDSVGAWIALARVYLNIGSYWERWNQLHQPVLGFTPQSPFRIGDCETHSVYWNATRLRVGPLRDYFLKVTPPMPLQATPGGGERFDPNLTAHSANDSASVKSSHVIGRVDISRLKRGREVFARNCMVCHSSIQPESGPNALFEPSENETADQAAKREEELHNYNEKYTALAQRRLDYREKHAKAGEYFEIDPAQWISDADYQRWAADVVDRESFWKWNYLSTDYRVPVTLVGTNSSRAMATNAMTGHVWEDFASESYRMLPSPGAINYFNPYLGEHGGDDKFTPRHKTPPGAPEGGGGPGYYRVPSLVSIWATAPFLHNNSLGVFNNDPSVDGRLEAFDDAIRKLLWPEKRLQSSSYNNATPARLKADHGLIWRTTTESTLTILGPKVPYFAKTLPWVSALHVKYPWLKDIAPLWLPSMLLLFGSLLSLLMHKDRRRRIAGFALLLLGGLFYLLTKLALKWPDSPFFEIIAEIHPSWLPVFILVGLGVSLLLPLSLKWRRYFGYAWLFLALVGGGIVYFNAGRLGDLTLAHIPPGTPVNLLANFNPDADQPTQIKSVVTALDGIAEIRSRHLSDKDSTEVMKKKVAPALMDVNKCPDFVMDKGHYFEWFKTMTDEDKNALIELLKTF